MLSKFTVDNFKRLLNEPRLIWGEFAKLRLHANKIVHSYLRGEQAQIMAEDWDNLIILDGCRYDTFAHRNTLEGKLEQRLSAGSQSLDFINHNFVGRTLHDTVYVTANPFASVIEPNTFHELISLLDHWNYELQTVTPETMVEAARRAFDKYPHKRLILHFMQPHYPFIGPTGRSLDHRGYHPYEEGQQVTFSVWDELQYGVADYELSEVIEAYEENLDIVLEHVEDLVQSLEGRTVITSDHGNLLGERVGPIPVRGYGHPTGLRTDELITVPWFIIDGGHRDIFADPPVEMVEMDESVVEERLTALGYTE